jgi:hypothetical protein
MARLGAVGALVGAAASVAAGTVALGAQTASVAVHRCATSSALGGPLARLPARIPISASASVAKQLSAYDDGYLTVLAPSGWQCSAEVGADGSVGFIVAPDVAGPLRAPAISAAYFGTSGEAASYACDLFPAADRWLPLPPCGVRVPRRELVTRTGTTTVAFEDPVGVKGDGEPSGGADPTDGVRVYVAPSAALRGYALGESCALPGSEHALCTVVLDDFRSRNPPRR